MVGEEKPTVSTSASSTCLLCKLAMRTTLSWFMRFSLGSFRPRGRTSDTVICLVKTIGIRLVGLQVKAPLNLESRFIDDDIVIVIISRHSPNLRSLSYWSIKTDPHIHLIMTERGLAALVEGCPKLEKLKLCMALVGSWIWTRLASLP